LTSVRPGANAFIHRTSMDRCHHCTSQASPPSTRKLKLDLPLTSGFWFGRAANERRGLRSPAADAYPASLVLQLALCVLGREKGSMLEPSPRAHWRTPLANSWWLRKRNLQGSPTMAKSHCPRFAPSQAWLTLLLKAPPGCELPLAGTGGPARTAGDPCRCRKLGL